MRQLQKLVGLIIICFSFQSVSFARANPAAQNCASIPGSTYIMINQTGICLFKDNTYCEEWALMHQSCKDGDLQFPGTYNPNNLRNYCIVKMNKQTIVKICKAY